MSHIPDTGAYIVSYFLDHSCDIAVGKLGLYPFGTGHYHYVGSAMRGLKKRVERHISREKSLRWHIDYFSIRAIHTNTLLIPSTQREECLVAKYLTTVRDFSQPIKNFGSSDCRCHSHFFYSDRPITLSHSDIRRGISLHLPTD